MMAVEKKRERDLVLKAAKEAWWGRGTSPGGSCYYKH